MYFTKMNFQTLVKDDVRQIQFKIHLPPIPHPRCTYREFVTAQYHWKYLIRIHTLQLPCLYDVLQGTGRFLCTIC